MYEAYFFTPCDFIVMAWMTALRCPLCFQLCGERVDFCFLPPTPSSLIAIFPPPAIFMHNVPPANFLEIEVFSDEGGPHMRFIGPSYLSPATSAYFRDAFSCAKEVVNTTITLHCSFSLPPPPLSPTDLR